MTLNLQGTDSYKEHLVMHEFGHALGLGHEHQRAVFWINLKDCFRKDVVEEFFNSFTDFKTDGKSYGAISGWTSEYDPHSIMHYWWVWSIVIQNIQLYYIVYTNTVIILKGVSIY